MAVRDDVLYENNSIFLSKTDEIKEEAGEGETLEIRFNPEISNFKYNVKETAVQTLGRQYPIIRRNGNTKYRSFTIKGLLSKEQDEWNFITSTLYPNEEETVADFKREKEYRDEVIKFLYDGEKKYFQSATEGEMWIKLMNVNLTPMTQLGRRLYSFSADAIEVEE